MNSGIETRCRVCGNDQFSIWGEQNGSSLYQCQNCQLVFFFPYPSQEELNTFYQVGYHNDRGYSGVGEAGILRKKMYKLDIEDLEIELPSGGRFLDVGCAEGVFLSMLGEHWEKYGIDISQSAVEKAGSYPDINAQANDISQVDDDFFDVVHLRGVFEHLLDPLEFVRIANKKLKATGTLVLSNTPNVGGIVPRLFRGRFRLVLVNEHVNYFTVQTMRVLSEKGGFSLHKVKYPYFNTPYSSFYKDLWSIPYNLITGKPSPPFWGNIFTIYATKTCST